MKEHLKRTPTLIGQFIGIFIGILIFLFFLITPLIILVVDLILNWYYTLCILSIILPFYLAVQFRNNSLGLLAIFTLICVPIAFNFIYKPPMKHLSIDFNNFSLKIQTEEVQFKTKL